MSTTFEPTHRILLTRTDGKVVRTTEVCLVDGVAYTREQWLAQIQPEWRCDDSGVWTFCKRDTPLPELRVVIEELPED